MQSIYLITVLVVFLWLSIYGYLLWKQMNVVKRMDAHLRQEYARTEKQEQFRLSREYVVNTHLIYDWAWPHEVVMLPDWSGDFPVPILELHSYLAERNVNVAEFYEIVRALNRRQYKILTKIILGREGRIGNSSVDVLRPIITALALARRDSIPRFLMIDETDRLSSEFSDTIRMVRIVTLLVRSVVIDKDEFYGLYVNEPDVQLSPLLTERALHSFFEASVGAYWAMSKGNELPFPTTIYNDPAVKPHWPACPFNDIGGGINQIDLVSAILTAYSIITKQHIPSCLVYRGKLAIQLVNILRSTTQTLRVI